MNAVKRDTPKANMEYLTWFISFVFRVKQTPFPVPSWIRSLLPILGVVIYKKRLIKMYARVTGADVPKILSSTARGGYTENETSQYHSMLGRRSNLAGNCSYICLISGGGLWSQRWWNVFHFARVHNIGYAKSIENGALHVYIGLRIRFGWLYKGRALFINSITPVRLKLDIYQGRSQETIHGRHTWW